MRKNIRKAFWLNSLLGAVLFVPLTALEAAGAEPAASQRRPNIIILLADDLGFADPGFQGCKDIPTPHLDDLAAGGIRCTQGYVSGPYCSPTRAGLLTGRYQQRFGHEFNPGPQRGAKAVGLPLSESTIADRLKAAGYATGLVGKWHLGADPQFWPPRRGFDEFFGFLGGAHAYFPERGAPIYRMGQDSGTKPISEIVDEKEYLTDAWSREAVKFIERHQQQPFFLYLAFNAVHTPMQATDERMKRFASIEGETRRTYAAMLCALDEATGRVLQTVRRLGLEKNTLFFFFSDNGGPTMRGTTINGSRNTPLRGSKRTTLEGGIRVPFVVNWKGTLKPGAYDKPVVQLDVLPTALAAAGVDAQPDWKLDGVNLLPHLKGEAAGVPHETLYWRLGTQMAVRHGAWKLVRYDTAADGERSPQASPARLYHLANDLGEEHDLAATQPDRTKELQALWDKWNSELSAPLWGPGARAVR